MEINRRTEKKLWIYWAMQNDQFINQFNDLQNTYKDYKFATLDSSRTDEKIFDECIIILDGSTFKKNVKLIEQSCYLYKIYIFDEMSHLYQNLQVDYHSVRVVTNDLKDIKSCIDEDSSDICKLFN